MKCRSCSADIADKAIVCYRCGTPTANPAAVAPRAPLPRSRAWIVVLLIAAAAAAVLIYFAYGPQPPG